MNKKYILKKSYDIEKLLKDKKSVGSKYYVIYYKFSESEIPQIAVSVSKRVGNAVTRVHYMRDLVHLFLDNYAVTYNMFATDNVTGKLTVLPDGELVSKVYLDGCGREDTAEWYCVKASEIYKKNN